jgi:hypothetical protein
MRLKTSGRLRIRFDVEAVRRRLRKWGRAAVTAAGIRVGLNLFRNGTLNTDDYAMYDTIGAPSL